MIGKAFPIDFVRQVIEQTLLEEHNKNPHFFGGKNQVNLFSFYEQLQKEDEVNRYVEIYRDLADQQNRTGLIMNGTIIAPENPTITNLYNCTIIPMSFTCSFRVNIGDRDTAIETINNLISILKGRKQDIALFENGQLFKVGTLGVIYNNIDPYIKNGDFIADYIQSGSGTFDTDSEISDSLDDLAEEGLEFIDETYPKYLYYGINNGTRMCVAYKETSSSNWVEIVDDRTKTILFPPQNTKYERYKLSLSFDSIRCDEPFNLNAEEYVTISFGGSATLVNEDVSLGNDLIKVGIRKYKIVADTPITFENEDETWFEPLEQPSGNNANTRINQLISNNFVSNTHTDSIGVSIQYSFVLDKSVPLLKQLWQYARYGIQGNQSDSYANGVTPNMIYKIYEVYSSWGNYIGYLVQARIVESIDIENTESDVESITIPFQIQGDND